MAELFIEDFEQCCPGADIRHEYDADYAVWNGVERSRVPFKTRNHKYVCTNCGKEVKRLAKTEEGS